MTFLRIVMFEHDLFGKPVSTFPDHALAISRPARSRNLSQIFKTFENWEFKTNFNALKQKAPDISAGRCRCETSEILEFGVYFKRRH